MFAGLSRPFQYAVWIDQLRAFQEAEVRVLFRSEYIDHRDPLRVEKDRSAVLHIFRRSWQRGVNVNPQLFQQGHHLQAATADIVVDGFVLAGHRMRYVTVSVCFAAGSRDLNSFASATTGAMLSLSM